MGSLVRLVVGEFDHLALGLDLVGSDCCYPYL